MNKPSENEEYWARRAVALEKAWHKRCQDTVEKDLARYYEQSLAEIQKEIAVLYGRYSKDNKLTLKEAHALLTGSEYKIWRMSLEDYVAKAKGDKGLTRELNTLAMRSRISRLDALYADTLKALDKLGRSAHDDMQSFLEDAYKDKFYHGLYDVSQKTGRMPVKAMVNARDVENVVGAPWSGKPYSSRIWANKRKLGQTIRNTIGNGVHRGLSINKLSKMVEDDMHAGLSNAHRLVRTEMNHVQNQAALDSIKKSGMKYFRFIATLDRRTSATCRAHDGHVYPIDEASIGGNVPPLHPNCRSTISGSLKDYVEPGNTRTARDDKGKTVLVPQGMTYPEWKSVFVDKKMSVKEWGVKPVSKITIAAKSELKPATPIPTDSNSQKLEPSSSKLPLAPQMENDGNIEDKGKETIPKIVKNPNGKNSKQDEPFVPYERRSYPELTKNDFVKMSRAHNKNLATDIKKQIASHPNPDPNDSAKLGYIGTHNYTIINGYLRGESYYVKMIEKGDAVALDNLKTIESMRRVISTHTLGRDCTLFRYVNSTELTRLWGIRDPRPPRPDRSATIHNNFFNLVGTKKYAQPILDELKKHVGESISDKAFLSTSVVRDKNIMKDKLVLYEIKAPKETHCYVTKNRAESECILGENTKLVIEKVEYIGLIQKFVFTMRVEL